jgi:hypothetical protein
MVLLPGFSCIRRASSQPGDCKSGKSLLRGSSRVSEQPLICSALDHFFADGPLSRMF